MKKVLSLILTAMLVVTSLFVLSGCGSKNENKGYSKEVVKYTTLSRNESGEVSFEIAKDLPYEVSKGLANTFVLKSTENYSEIQVTAYYDYKTSSTITKTEKSFYSDKYHDFQNVKVGDFEGWSIYNGEYSYEIEFIVTEPDESNKVYAVDVQVIKSPVMKENMTFNVKDFVESDDFQHLLNSIEFNLIDKTENNAEE